MSRLDNKATGWPLALLVVIATLCFRQGSSVVVLTFQTANATRAIELVEFYEDESNNIGQFVIVWVGPTSKKPVIGDFSFVDPSKTVTIVEPAVKNVLSRYTAIPPDLRKVVQLQTDSVFVDANTASEAESGLDEPISNNEAVLMGVVRRYTPQVDIDGDGDLEFTYSTKNATVDGYPYNLVKGNLFFVENFDDKVQAYPEWLENQTDTANFTTYSNLKEFIIAHPICDDIAFQFYTALVFPERKDTRYQPPCRLVELFQTGKPGSSLDKKSECVRFLVKLFGDAPLNPKDVERSTNGCGDDEVVITGADRVP